MVPEEDLEREGRRLQWEDLDLSRVASWITADKLPSFEVRCTLPPQTWKLLREWERLRLVNGVLIRQVRKPDTGMLCEQLVLPNSHSQAVWREYHHALGHAGKEKVLSVFQRRFYWPGMTKDAKNWTVICPTCVVSKPGPEPRAPLQSIKTSYPFEVVGLDYLSLGRPTDPFPDILVITDLFSRYALAVPIRDQTAQTTVKALTSALIQPFGCPERILTDRGAAFESSLMRHLCELYGCVKSRTTPYHPQGNGAYERFNQTLLGLLGSLDEGSHHQWHIKLPALMQAYNNSVHASTGMTPHFVVFGRHARLPVDLIHGVCPPQHREGLEGWVHQHHHTLLEAYERTKENATRQQARDQQKYNKGAINLPLLPGERVLVRNFRRTKLSSRWVPSPFVVVSQLRPAYVVHPEGKEGPTQTLHRNNLRPCGLLLEPETPRGSLERTKPAPQPLVVPIPGFPINPLPQVAKQPTYFGLPPYSATVPLGQNPSTLTSRDPTRSEPITFVPDGLASPEIAPVCPGPLNSALDAQTEMSGPVGPEEVVLISRDQVEAEDNRSEDAPPPPIRTLQL